MLTILRTNFRRTHGYTVAVKTTRRGWTWWHRSTEGTLTVVQFGPFVVELW
jgi:hypothetical protein